MEFLPSMGKGLTNMTLFKSVNGKRVKLTAKEEVLVRAEWADNDKKQKDNLYKIQRSKEYPPIGDQLDTIINTLSRLKEVGMVDIGQEAELLVENIRTIKAKYPKPVTPIK